jgi:DNA-binding GntR family transcriptional regulator
LEIYAAYIYCALRQEVRSIKTEFAEADWETSPPSRRLTKSEQAYQRLRDQILTLSLKPGTMLDEATLTKSLGLGRTPVREAIQRLALEQLVVAHPGHTPYVAPIDLRDLPQIFEWRCLIEREAVGLACRRITPEQVQACQEIIRRQAELSAQRNFTGAVRCDYEFHNQLAAATGNQLLLRAVAQVNRLSLRLWYVSFVHGGPLGDAPVQHQEILEKVAQGQVEAAQSAMVSHIEAFRRRLQLLG